MDIDALRDELRSHGQEHLLAGWASLSEDDRHCLYKQLSAIDYSRVVGYFKRCTADLAAGDIEAKPHEATLEPLPVEAIGRASQCDDGQIDKYREAGLHKISEGKVAVLLLAGGQGTRLGVSYPKGMYDVGLPSHKTLYQIQGERLYRLKQLAKQLTGKMGAVPWYIMASEHTKKTTQEYFEKHNYFGNNADDVVFFEQHMLPCFTFDGKIILETPSKVAKAPDGNGGLYRALDTSGILDNMKGRGIEYVHVYCVDNILVKIADPVFLGFCMEKNANCAAKAVEKTIPTEAVGVICKRDGVYQVVEYSEISLATAEKRDADGRLAYNAGNICNHVFTFDFLENVVRKREDDLKHHIAKKKIPFYDFEAGEAIKPVTPNGIKMEKFIFDVFEFTQDFAVWEVLREEEFSPLKNADTQPKDTPTTARHSIYELHRRHVIRAGGTFVDTHGNKLGHIHSKVCDANDNDIPQNSSSTNEEVDETHAVCEISPLLSYAGEGLESLVKGKSFVPPVCLTSTEEKRNGADIAGK